MGISKLSPLPAELHLARIHEVQRQIIEDMDKNSPKAIMEGCNEAADCLDKGMSTIQAYQCGRYAVLRAERKP